MSVDEEAKVVVEQWWVGSNQHQEVRKGGNSVVIF